MNAESAVLQCIGGSYAQRANDQALPDALADFTAPASEAGSWLRRHTASAPVAAPSVARLDLKAFSP